MAVAGFYLTFHFRCVKIVFFLNPTKLKSHPRKNWLEDKLFTTHQAGIIKLSHLGRIKQWRCMVIFGIPFIIGQCLGW